MKTAINIAAAALLLTLPACKKETVATPTLQEQITGKKWRSIYHATNGMVFDKWCYMNAVFEFTNAGSLYVTAGDNNGACTPNVVGAVTKSTYRIDANTNYYLIPNSYPTKCDTFEVTLISTTEMRTRHWANVHTELWEDRYTAD